jgi:hypothetical protein
MFPTAKTNKTKPITPNSNEEFQKLFSVVPVELVDENNDEKLPLLLEDVGVDDNELPIELLTEDVAADVLDATLPAVSLID